MPPKRKRRGSQSTDGHNDSEDTSSLPGVSMPKRRRFVPGECIEICQELFDTIRNEQMESGQLICEPFIKLPKKKTDPEYFETIADPIDLTIIQQKIKSRVYEDVEQMANDIEQLVNNAKSYYADESLECQLADALWELFCECKLRLVNDETPFIDDDGEDSRLSSATDDVSRSTLPVGDAISECLKVPVLKLKVGTSGGYVDSASVSQADCTNSSLITPSNDCSSDFDGASENQSMSTTQGRLSSCSEIDDQLTTECPRVIIKPMRKLDNPSEGAMGLRERRYAYRDFITPKQRRRRTQDPAAANEKESDGAVSENDSGDNQYEQLLAAVTNATDGNRQLCEAFKILPLRSKYVDYYQVIKEPIDLRTIAQKIQSNAYSSLDEMTKDLFLMVQNAKTFNKPNSTIYRDAVALRKVVVTAKNELEQPNRAASASGVIRTRTRGSGTLAVNGVSVSSTLAVLRGESEDEEIEQSNVKSPPNNDDTVFSTDTKGEDGAGSDADDSSSDEETSDLWTLFKTIYNYRTNLGLRLAEPFIRLPSRRIYPDYYQEIKRPLSLTKIRKKLRSDRYSDLDDLADDINLVFENAKQYNMEDSKIYKDAVKLQGMLNAKKQELQPNQPSKEMTCEQPPNRSRQATPDTPVDDVSNSGPKQKRVRSTSSDDVLKKRLMTIHKYLMDYQFDGRHLIDIFITLPLKKDYPDYYKVISEPIDMTMIENRIKADKYPNQQALVEDLELMFKNARHYNEELSQVYKDAETLERLLHSRIRSLPPIDDGSPASMKFPPRSSLGRAKVKPFPTLSSKLQELYNTVRDYTDAHGRILSTPFMKLPSKNEYPDYYEVIKKPIDMQKVLQKVTGAQYGTVDDMASDFVLMFDNACRYNEPDSLIYKDSLTLQRVCLSKKAELGDDDDANELPDVPSLVQSLLTSLFISTISHMDEEGRCFGDSFLELPTRLSSEEDASQPIRLAPSFEQIKHNLEKGRYKRLDRLQDDMFEVFEYARKVSSVDSQVYEDSVELQLYFIQQRDDLCRKGEVLLSPALNYTDVQLKAMLESVRRERIKNEQCDEDEQKKVAAQNNSDSNQAVICNGKEKSCDTVEHNGQSYSVGDFVYIEPRDRDKGLAPQIVCIERMWKNEDGDSGLYGCWFLRPNETFHLATRKFLQKEVFKSDFYDDVSFHKVLGKCFVMSVKDYFRNKPQGFADNDVYVCESRYFSRGKSFKKIKIWPVPKNEHVKLIPREQSLPAVRVASVFADGKSNGDAGAGASDRLVDSSQTSVLDPRREPVLLEKPAAGSEDGFVYYEQIKAPACWLKLGDCVYLKSVDASDQPIVMIEKLWTTPSGESFLSGPHYVTAAKVEHAPNRLFYKKEVFHISREGMVPLSSVTGHCAVLSYKEYCTSRFTEVAEPDVYICESKYSDVDKVIKKFNKPFKRVSLSASVREDEMYFFKKPITPKKELLPVLPKHLEMAAAVDDESMDCPSSIEQSFNDGGSCQGDSTLDNTPSSNKKRRSAASKANNKMRQISGYIVYAAECRKDIQAEFPGQTFGDISRIVGNKWKALPKELKDRYEDRARAIAADHAAKNSTSSPVVVAQYPASNIPSPGATEVRSQSPNLMSAQPGYNVVTAQNGNAPMYCNQLSGSPAVPPSQVMSPLHHQLPNQPPPRLMAPYPPGPGQPPAGSQYHHGMVTHLVAPYSVQQPVCYPNAPYQGSVAPPAAPKPPPPPMFASVPPQTQRLVHTDAYLRYIEGMSSGSPTVGSWEKSLNAKVPDNAAAYSTDKLPVHWLANGAGHHDNAVNALWALRDHMMKDAFTISRVLDFSQV